MTTTLITAHPTRPFLILEAEQRSPEWFEYRLGRVTGSVAAAVWDTKKDKSPTAEWAKLQDKLLAERLTGMNDDDIFVNYEMQRGIDLEPVARRALGKKIGAKISETGFLAHKDLMIGASLDGDIEDFQGVVELKCPKTTTHLKYIEGKGLPDQYEGQLYHNLYVTQADTLFFASFDDRLPPHLQLFVVERKAKDLPIEEYATRLNKFLAQLEERHQALSTGEFLPVF
jgi:putative phage-type endonuclease